MSLQQPTTITLLKTDISKRIFGLDILRAYTIMSVLIGHVAEYLPESCKFILYFFPLSGASIFFVLSGYLVGRMLLKLFNEDEVNGKSMLKFWVNRWMRIIPPYYIIFTIVLIASIAIPLSINPDFLGKKKILSYYLFLQNFNWAHFGFYAETWSLTIEEWFYTLTPIVLMVFFKVFHVETKKAFIFTIALFMITAVLFRIYKYVSLDLIELQQYYVSPYDMFFRKQVVTRIDSIMYGVLGAYITFYFKDFWTKYKYTILIAGIAIYVITYHMNFGVFNSGIYMYIFRLSVESLIILSLFPALSSIQKGSGFFYKLLTYIGLISYSLYLLHYTPIKYCIIENLNINSTAIKFTLFWVLSFGLATLSYLYIEKPSIDFRRKIKFLKK